jgi:hypothetical protein
MQKNIQNNKDIMNLINNLEENYINYNSDNIEFYINKLTNHNDLMKNLSRLFLILENNPNLDF